MDYIIDVLNKIKNLTLISIDKFQINNKFDYLFEINCLGYYVWNIQKDYYLKFIN